MEKKKLTPAEKRQLHKWRSNKNIHRVLKCNCGIVHEITVLYEFWRCPKCKRNLIWNLNPNWKNCFVLYDKILIEEKIPETKNTKVLDYCPETRRKNKRYGEPNLKSYKRKRRKKKSQ